MMVENFKVNELKENPKYSALVPEMSAIEWQEFIENVKKFGIRQPITINKDLTILDGRHRVRACKELGIEKITAIVNEMDEQQAIEYVRDTAIERRSLSVEQRLDIIFKCGDLMKGLAEEAKKRKIEGGEKGREIKRSGLTSQDTKPDKPKRTSEAIADMVGTSASSVNRFKRIRKESPEIYEEVVSGEKPILTAYKELPSVSGVSYESRKKNKGDSAMSMKVIIKAREIDNYDFERALKSWLEVYSEETDAVIEVDTREIPPSYEFDESIWELDGAE